MLRASDIDRAAPVTSEIRGCENAGRDARAEQSSVPFGVIVMSDVAWIAPAQHARDAGLHALERIVVPARGQGIAVVAVLRIGVRIPSAAPDPLDQGGLTR